MRTFDTLLWISKVASILVISSWVPCISLRVLLARWLEYLKSDCNIVGQQIALSFLVISWNMFWCWSTSCLLRFCHSNVQDHVQSHDYFGLVIAQNISLCASKYGRFARAENFVDFFIGFQIITSGTYRVKGVRNISTSFNLTPYPRTWPWCWYVCSKIPRMSSVRRSMPLLTKGLIYISSTACWMCQSNIFLRYDTYNIL